MEGTKQKIGISSHSTQKSLMRDVFHEMDKYGHGQVVFCRHSDSGLKAIIAIHDTSLGPAIGGCRMQPYASTDGALDDVLRLSRGMTYKCAAADVDFGGGKAVIIGDPNIDKSPYMFRALGRFIEGLNGRFYTGTDMGTNPEDFTYAARETKNIIGLPIAYGGGGDTSIPTALGVLQGMKATAMHLWDTNSLSGKKVSLVGVGKVGEKLLELLVQEGVHCTIADINKDKLLTLKERLPGVEIQDLETLIGHPCDIFAPCAQGGIINEQSISKLQCKAIVGSANNQLAEDRFADDLMNQGILYAPDYIVNAGGLIQVADEIQTYNEERVIAKTMAIFDTLLQIYNHAAQRNISTCQASEDIVRERIERQLSLRSIISRGW